MTGVALAAVVGRLGVAMVLLRLAVVVLGVLRVIVVLAVLPCIFGSRRLVTLLRIDMVSLLDWGLKRSRAHVLSGSPRRHPYCRRGAPIDAAAKNKSTPSFELPAHGHELSSDPGFDGSD